MSECIFISPPQECYYLRERSCSIIEFIPSVILGCLANHKRLMLSERGKAKAIKTYTEQVIESPNRIKSISGEAGRKSLE